MDTTAYAAFLHALADHYDTHPDLQPMYLSPHGALQLAGGSSVGELILWAESLGVTEFTVQRGGPGENAGWCHLQMLADIGGREVKIWTSVPALADSDLVYGSTLPVADLAAAVELNGALAAALAHIQASRASVGGAPPVDEDDQSRCNDCGWTGPSDDLGRHIYGVRTCPNCGSDDPTGDES